jgi:hypothetical protein
MSLDYNLTEVNRELWPDGGIDLFNFCVMQMLCGVGSLKKDKDLETLHFRAFALDRVRDFGWERCGLIALIPKMRGITTNVGDYNDGKFQKKLIEAAKQAFEDEKRFKARKDFEEKEGLPAEMMNVPSIKASDIE